MFNLSKIVFKKKILSYDANQFLNWLKKTNVKKDFVASGHSSHYEALLLLFKIFSESSGNLTRSDFVKYFFGTSSSKYLPIILSFSNIQNSSSEYFFLNLLKPIFAHAVVFEDSGSEDLASLISFLKKVDEDYNYFLERGSNDLFDDNSTTNKKLSKEEKKKHLFYYLIDNATRNLKNALSNENMDAALRLVSSDRMFLVNGASLKASGLVYPNRDRGGMIVSAENLSKTILKRVEPQDYEYNYNLLINYAMKHNYMMSESEYNSYFYNLILDKGRGNSNVMDRKYFSSSSWLNPGVIEFIAITLTIIMSRIKF